MRVQWACALSLALATLAFGHPPDLILYPQQLQFPVPATVSVLPTRQLFFIQNGTHGDMEWTTQITTSSGGNWLSMSPSSGMLPNSDDPSSMNTYVSVSPAGLKPGVYTGTITVTASRLYAGTVYAATHSPQTVTVTYTVYEASVPSVKVSTNAVTLQGVAGIGAATSASAGISNAGPGTLIWSATANVNGAGSWLSVSPASGMNASTLTITANPGSLAPGTYTGNVSVSAPGSPTAVIAVTYNVRAPTPPQLQLSAQPLNFSILAGSANVPPQTISVINPGETPLNWRVASSTFNGGAWLSVAPALGTNNGAISVSANTADLSPGIYAGKITISADGAANSPAQVQVNLTVRRGSPSLDGGGFYNAASLSPDGVVPGSIASIFGIRLGPDVGVSFTADPNTPTPPVSLAGTRVTFDGAPAPLFYVSANQINLQIPLEVAGKPVATARIEAEGYDPAEFKVNLNPSNLGIFSVDGTRAAALNQDGSLNSPVKPAAAGSIVQFYATGQGTLDEPVPTGALAPLQAPFPAPTNPVALKIGGLPAKVIFAGLAPGMVGMLQINVQVPSDLPPADLVPVEAQSGSGKPKTVYISTGPAPATNAP